MKNGGKDQASDSEKEKLNNLENGWTVTRPSQQFNVVRRVYQQEALNKDAEYQAPERPLSRQCKKLINSCGFAECIYNALPIAKWLPKYKPKKFLVGDLVAGATTAIMHIPQGMAYALLAEVPPIVGLYMAFFPSLIYVIFGTSPHISVGTFAVACLMVGKVVTQHAYHPDLVNITNSTNASSIDPTVIPAGAYSPLQILSVVCLTVALMQILMWVLRLGVMSTLLSEPLVSGFTTAASFHVLASQLKDLIGLRIPKTSGNFKVIITLIHIFTYLPNLNWAAVIISVVTCTIVALNNELLKPWVSKRSRVPVPIELLAIVIGTTISRFMDLHGTFGISLVGKIPTGFPKPHVPAIELVPVVAIDAFTITMVTYSISMSMALIFAAKEKYEVDSNQELLALGAANLLGSFFSCAPICASLSRSYIQYQAGAKTGLTTVVSAMLVLCVLLWIGPFFEALPRAVLASIIVVSLKGMFMQVKELIKFYRLSKLDAIVWMLTFISTICINIDIGLAVGLVASLGALFCRSQMPYTCLLGRVFNTDIYLDTKRYLAAEEIPGIKIFHFCGGLTFASKNQFRDKLYRKIGFLVPTNKSNESARSLQRMYSYERDPGLGRRIHCLILDASALAHIDAPGVRTLNQVRKELAANSITMLISGANGPVQEMIDVYNKFEGDPVDVEMFATVHDAVVHFKIHEGKKEKAIQIQATV